MVKVTKIVTAFSGILMFKIMIKSDYIVFDCETGGLDETKNPITQFACVILDGTTLKETDRWETYVKPYAGLKIEQDVLEHTMVTMSDINSGVDLALFTSTLTKFLESHRAKTRNREMGRLVPVGHNVTFDIRFINAALALADYEEDLSEWLYPNLIDTFALGKMTWGVGKDRDEKLNLGTCCERAKIKLTDAHGAMNDVEATAELFRWYVKKMRSKKGSSGDEESGTRPRGSEFFEFKCGV